MVEGLFLGHLPNTSGLFISQVNPISNRESHRRPLGQRVLDQPLMASRVDCRNLSRASTASVMVFLIECDIHGSIIIIFLFIFIFLIFIFLLVGG